MRLIHFFLTFLAVAVLVVGSIFWINRDSFLTVFQNRAALLEGSEWVEKTYSLGGLVEYISEQPEHASVAHISESRMAGEQPHQEIRFHSDKSVPAGTLSHLMLFITYADLVTSGDLDPEAPVDPDAVRSFHIPGMDQRHKQRFDNWLSGLKAPPTVENLVQYLSLHNDPAAADYLYFFLGAEEVTKMTSQIGDGTLEAPIPLFGIRMTALQNSAPPEDFATRLQALTQKNRGELLQKAEAVARSQWDNPETIPSFTIRSFQDERMLHGLYPRIQPDRFAGLLIEIWEGSLVSREVSDICKSLLITPAGDSRLEQYITEFASRYDERMGYLTGWSIGKHRENEVVSAQVILFYDLPAGLWFHMNSNFMTRDFHHRLLYDETLKTRTYNMLMNPDQEPLSHTYHSGM